MPKTTHSQNPLKSPGDPHPEPAPAPGDPTGPDAPPPRPEAIKKPATGGASGSGNAIQAQATELSALQGKILPPSSPVEVPRLPPKPTADTPDEARNYGQPRIDSTQHDNWADSVKPKPDAKHARTHLI